MNTTEEANNRGEYDISLLETLITYIRYWKLFLVSMLIFILLGYIYIKLQIPQYKIETDLLIKDNKPGMSSQNDLLKDMGLFTSEKIIDNEIQILQSNLIIDNVVNALKLETSYFSNNGVRKWELYKALPFQVQLLNPSANAYTDIMNVQIVGNHEAIVNNKKVELNVPIYTDEGTIIIKPDSGFKFTHEQGFKVKFNDLIAIRHEYKNKLKIEPASKQATVLIITIEDAIPQRGKDFLNRLVFEYNRAAIQDKNKVTSATLAFIEGRLRLITTELSSVENNVERYKSNNKITDISAESQIFLQGVQDNDAQLNKVQIQLSVLENLERYLNNNGQQPSRLPSTLGIEDPTLVGLISKLGEAQLRKQSMLQTVPEDNPVVASIANQITSIEQTINSTVQSLKHNLEITKKELLEKNSRYESIITHVPTKERGLLDVMRKQEIQNNLFTYLLQKREETAMSLASVVADSRTIDLASSSRNPVKPVQGVIYLAFIVLGIMIPGVFIYLKGRLNFKVSRRADIESSTETPIVAEISQSDEAGGLLVSSNPRSMVAEQIRALRTNLQFIIPNENQKVILFTSSISGEGKSFASLNLGASLAMAGKKTVILELDLRKPKLHRGLEIENTFGLSNFLIGKLSYNEIIKPINIQENYFIITSGPIPPNPAELLQNGRINILIEQLKKEFDFIILDAPPVGLVTDAQILGEYADLTLFIVRHNYTAKNHISNIDDLYQLKKFKNLNIVLNSIDLQMGYGSSYGYGYGYGYGGGYYSDNSNSRRSGDSILNRIFKRIK